LLFCPPIVVVEIWRHVPADHRGVPLINEILEVISQEPFISSTVSVLARGRS
jgi:hypothetical protein